MDIARDICTDSFYIVNSGLPCIAVTAVRVYLESIMYKAIKWVLLVIFLSHVKEFDSL